MKPLQLAAAGLVIALAAATALVASPPQLTTGSTAAAALTAADIVEIQQLAVRYTYALDSGAFDGEMFAGSMESKPSSDLGMSPNVCSVRRVRALGARQLTVTP